MFACNWEGSVSDEYEEWGRQLKSVLPQCEKSSCWCKIASEAEVWMCGDLSFKRPTQTTKSFLANMKVVWCSTACSTSQTLRQGLTTELSSSNSEDQSTGPREQDQELDKPLPFSPPPLRGSWSTMARSKSTHHEVADHMTVQEEGDQICGLPKSHASHGEAVPATIDKWKGSEPQKATKLSWTSISLKPRNISFGDVWAAEAFSIWISNTSTQGWFASLRLELVTSESHLQKRERFCRFPAKLAWRAEYMSFCFVPLSFIHPLLLLHCLSVPFCSVYSVLSVPLSYKSRCVYA